MNAETQQVITFLLDRHTEKDSLIKILTGELDKLKQEQQAAQNAKVPIPPPEEHILP